MIIDWAHLYLLAWWGEDGRSFLSTWDGDLPEVYVVVTGLGGRSMPLWNSPIPSGAEPHLVPEGFDHEKRLAYAAEKGGLLALAWYIEAGYIARDEPFSEDQIKSVAAPNG